MSTFEKIAGTMLGLVLVFLLLNNRDATTSIFSTLAKGTNETLRTLQGR